MRAGSRFGARGLRAGEFARPRLQVGLSVGLLAGEARHDAAADKGTVGPVAARVERASQKNAFRSETITPTASIPTAKPIFPIS